MKKVKINNLYKLKCLYNKNYKMVIKLCAAAMMLSLIFEFSNDFTTYLINLIFIIVAFIGLFR